MLCWSDIETLPICSICWLSSLSRRLSQVYDSLSLSFPFYIPSLSDISPSSDLCQRASFSQLWGCLLGCAGATLRRYLSPASARFQTYRVGSVLSNIFSLSPSVIYFSLPVFCCHLSQSYDSHTLSVSRFLFLSLYFLIALPVLTLRARIVLSAMGMSPFSGAFL
jgi:hypothetical protein